MKLWKKNAKPAPPKGRWKRRFKRLGKALLLLLLVFLLADWTGLLDRWARRAIVSRVEQATGGRVELKTFRLHTFGLRAELEDFTLHGREPEGTPPLFHADSIYVDIRVDSFFRRKVSLDELRIERPAVHVRFDEQGRSNVPEPPTPQKPGTPLRERIFDVVIRKLQMNHGEILYNHARVPLAAEGGEFHFTLDYHGGGSEAAFYEGRFDWKQMVLVARRYLPFPSDVAAKFRLTREAFTLDEFRWKLPQSDLRASARMENFAEPAWSFRYQGNLDLADLRAILRKPNTPGGTVEFSGEGRWAKGALDLRGRYDAREIAMPYAWFHATGMESSGIYHADRKHLAVTDFQARVLGGRITGRVDLEFSGMKFRAATRTEGMSLAGLLAAVNHSGFPVATLHWDGAVDIESLTTWLQDFKNVDSRGMMHWSPPLEPRPGTIPATAQLDYHYSLEEKLVELRHSEISTPASRVEVHGRLSARDSALEIKLRAGDLLPWNDFIQALRGPEAARRRIAGRADFTGRITGRLDGPTFTGHFKSSDAAFGNLFWDEIEGDLTYSPRGFRFERARARRGASLATLDVWLELDDWGFRPQSQWTLEAELVRAPTVGLQDLFGTAYPVQGLVTGQFRGGGTRANPEFTGLVDIAQVEAWGLHLDRARGQFVLRSDEIRVSNAEIRKATGRVTGNFRYGRRDGQVTFDLAGAVVPIDQIEWLQNPRLPFGGQLSFQVRGGGPLLAPSTEGSLRLVDLRVGRDVLGSLDLKLHSDGRRLQLEVGSAMGEGALEGRLEMTLGGDYPLHGDVTLKGMDVDAFLQTALRVPPQSLTGHSHVDGRFVLSGALARPGTIAVEGDVSRLTFDYRNVKLENVGPLRFTYRAEEVRVEQAHLRGAETDFTLSGSARFNGDRRVNLKVAGQVNLQLLGGFLPDLEARGSAQVNAAIEGTTSNPRINGRMHVEDAAANYGEVPTGLSHVRGDFVFDATRLLFEGVTAEAGGGTLTLGGSLSYGEGPLHYDISIGAQRVRIRYPVGMSWLASGTLRLSGTTRAALLSGCITVERLLMSEGFDFATLIGPAQGARGAPSVTSPFLRNLQFDIEAVSAPDARIEWSAARFESEARLRVRGTWERPILLGHIHLLSGEMKFRGNRYQLTRGDINFAKTFELDPELNLEAVTTIRQYEVTLNFSGPASKLVLAYRSDPPLPPNDIIALLALGRTAGERELRTAGTGTGQSAEAGATALLSEAISSQVGGRIERLFGVSRFRIDPFLTGTGTEQNAPARITIEQQVAHDLVITYVTNVSSTQQQIVQVEYAVNRNVSLVFLRDQNGTFGLDFKFKKRFK